EGPCSLEYFQAKDLFPPQGTSEGGGESSVLQGEGVEFLGRAADALIAISNYRLHIKFKDSVINFQKAESDLDYIQYRLEYEIKTNHSDSAGEVISKINKFFFKAALTEYFRIL
uniref:Ska2 N-terminal domain-containing protein n=1 Tax=Callithrix jacchus TaxID=9483 RepID=A0A8I3WZB2_CALJA